MSLNREYLDRESNTSLIALSAVELKYRITIVCLYLSNVICA